MSIQTSFVRPAPPVRSYAATADLAIPQGSEANDRSATVASPKNLRSEPAPINFVRKFTPFTRAIGPSRRVAVDMTLAR